MLGFFCTDRPLLVTLGISSMSLASVLQSAHSGMSAASVAVDAVSLNMANSLTNRYKSFIPYS